jgi:protein-L-isoaspartate(D-aspartate) O-methyltransferase
VNSAVALVVAASGINLAVAPTGAATTITVTTPVADALSYHGMPKRLKSGVHRFRYVNRYTLSHDLKVGSKSTPFFTGGTRVVRVRPAKGKVRYRCTVPGHAAAGMKGTGLVRMLRRQGISGVRVLAAMGAVPRDEFVPEDPRRHAWDDCPLPIGAGQTISQPYVVAYMAQSLRLPVGSTVLDVGTGCGYQAAILSQWGCRMHSVEIREGLARRARATLTRPGYEVEVVGDGWRGLAERSPFDGIAVAAAGHLPEALVAQLRVPGGLMVIPWAVPVSSRCSSRHHG